MSLKRLDAQDSQREGEPKTREGRISVIYLISLYGEARQRRGGVEREGRKGREKVGKENRDGGGEKGGGKGRE